MVKRLFFDIETSPCLGWFWKPGYNLTLDYNNIIENAKIICICYKWAGKNTVHYLTWDKKQDDKLQLQKFISVLGKADEIVGHNSDKFDIKWLRTRCYYHGIQMMPNYTSVDTLKEARKGFRFPSNRLDSIGKYLGIGQKKKTVSNLWEKVWRNNDRKALMQMVSYCKQDVILLEDFYNKISSFIKPKISVSGYRCNCPNCDSEDVKINQNYKMASGYQRWTMRCKGCGKYFTVSPKTFIAEQKRRDRDKKDKL